MFPGAFLGYEDIQGVRHLNLLDKKLLFLCLFFNFGASFTFKVHVLII